MAHLAGIQPVARTVFGRPALVDVQTPAGPRQRCTTCKGLSCPDCQGCHCASRTCIHTPHRCCGGGSAA